MTRGEEIRRAAGNVAIRDNKGQYAHGFLMQALREAFTEGAQWADRTMIERASQWLANNAHEYQRSYYGFPVYSHKGNCRFCAERRKQEKDF